MKLARRLLGEDGRYVIEMMDGPGQRGTDAHGFDSWSETVNGWGPLYVPPPWHCQFEALGQCLD